MRPTIPIIRNLDVVLAAGALLALAPAALKGQIDAVVPGVCVEQTTRGLPGGGPKKGTRTSYQTLVLAADGGALTLRDYSDPKRESLDRTYILRRESITEDARVFVWEVSGDGRYYREHHGDLNQSQKNRRVAELDQVRQILSQYHGEEEAAALSALHLRRDGRRLVDVAGGTETRILGYPSRQVVLTENGRTIVDAMLTEELGSLTSYYQIYRKLGVFSDEVLAKLRDFRGLPLRAKLTVVTELPTYTLEVEVTKVAAAQIPAAEFELPPGAQKVEDTPRSVPCPTCRKLVDTDAPGGRIRRGAAWIYFCSESCARTYSAKLPKGVPGTADPFESGGPGRTESDAPPPRGEKRQEIEPRPAPLKP